jgi:hypothetical protein
LGLHGHECPGLESEILVWVAYAQSAAGLELVRMEFRRFLHAIVLLPAQIVRSGRKIIYRIMGYNSWLKDFFAAWENLRRMAPA